VSPVACCNAISILHLKIGFDPEAPTLSEVIENRIKQLQTKLDGSKSEAEQRELTERIHKLEKKLAIGKLLF
jgi:hypothetical protein